MYHKQNLCIDIGEEFCNSVIAFHLGKVQCNVERILELRLEF